MIAAGCCCEVANEGMEAKSCSLVEPIFADIMEIHFSRLAFKPLFSLFSSPSQSETETAIGLPEG